MRRFQCRSGVRLRQTAYRFKDIMLRCNVERGMFPKNLGQDHLQSDDRISIFNAPGIRVLGNIANVRGYDHRSKLFQEACRKVRVFELAVLDWFFRLLDLDNALPFTEMKFNYRQMNALKRTVLVTLFFPFFGLVTAASLSTPLISS